MTKSTKMALITPTDLELIFADEDFVWAGERYPGLPILCWPDGTICEPALAYFGHSAKTRRVRISSMVPEAYAIRDFFAFQATKKKVVIPEDVSENEAWKDVWKAVWEDVNDLTISEWREGFRAAQVSGKLSHAQVERKISSVFNFYKLLPEAMPFDEDGEAQKIFVGKNNARGKITFPISTKMTLGRFGKVHEVWSRADKIGKKQTRRPTPDEIQVKKILTFLRAKSDCEPSRRNHGHVQHWAAVEAERNWLIGRCMVHGGLRGEEAAELSLTAIRNALELESIRLPNTTSTKRQYRLPDLDKLSELEQDALLAALDVLEARHRTCLYVAINGKGKGDGKTRTAPFTIDLVRDLLAIGIWSVRSEQVADWSVRSPGYTAPDLIFLSAKSKAGLRPGTIGDLMKDAYNAVGVAGSGHRLRAYYATMMAIHLWDECMALNGGNWSQAAENTVLDRLASALGHSTSATSLRYYLDMAQVRYFGVSSRGKLNAARQLWDRVVKQLPALSEGKLALLTKVVNTLAAQPDDSMIQQLFAMAISDAEINPSSATTQTKAQKTSHLRLIRNNGRTVQQIGRSEHETSET